MIGTHLGPYELQQEVGKGGMATVYRAYQTSVDRYVAVKVIHKNIAGDEVALCEDSDSCCSLSKRPII